MAKKNANNFVQQIVEDRHNDKVILYYRLFDCDRILTVGKVSLLARKRERKRESLDNWCMHLIVVVTAFAFLVLSCLSFFLLLCAKTPKKIPPTPPLLHNPSTSLCRSLNKVPTTFTSNIITSFYFI